jgi:hypothetical protein
MILLVDPVIESCTVSSDFDGIELHPYGCRKVLAGKLCFFVSDYCLPNIVSFSPYSVFGLMRSIVPKL